MSDLSKSELRRLDLTLLLVFLGLLRHRKAAAVAEEMGLTQSAVSQALRRLRDVFGDELFLRRPHGMEPTATALALEAPVLQAVEALRGALGVARRFDPTDASGIIRIAALDAEQSVIIPALSARLRAEASRLQLSILPFGRGDAVSALGDGRVDLSLGFIWDRPDWVSGEHLYDEGFLVVGRPEALPQAPDISIEQYCAADHVLVSPAGEMRGIVDRRLEDMDLARRIVLGLPAFLPGLAAVAASDALITLPIRIARAFAPGFGLVSADPPIEIRSFPVSVFWHRRNDADPQTVWLRKQIRNSVQE